MTTAPPAVAWRRGDYEAALAEFLRGALAFAAAALEEDPFARRW